MADLQAYLEDDQTCEVVRDALWRLRGYDAASHEDAWLDAKAVLTALLMEQQP